MHNCLYENKHVLHKCQKNYAEIDFLYVNIYSLICLTACSTNHQ